MLPECERGSKVNDSGKISKKIKDKSKKIKELDE